jgi:hypothetical protein
VKVESGQCGRATLKISESELKCDNGSVVTRVEYAHKTADVASVLFHAHRVGRELEDPLHGDQGTDGVDR